MRGIMTTELDGDDGPSIAVFADTANSGAAHVAQALAAEGPVGPAGVRTSVDSVLESTGRRAARELGPFVQQLGAAGWQVAPFMLSSAEKGFFSFMD